jgi:hypothetical protein
MKKLRVYLDTPVISHLDIRESYNVVRIMPPAMMLNEEEQA